MRHHVTIKKFGLEKKGREALMKSLAEALIVRGRIKTTEAKAKALRPFIERLVTTAKKGTIAARRLLVTRLGTDLRATKLFNEIAPKYQDRPGGYTRVIKAAPRKGDASPMAYIEFV